ncbi:uncharacterized protein METZ01_LOCUS99385 [marine metagenome]|uniref:Uncharacterized protein n=1 Tax=marine metagenome TaxID=408172 RepID=A0A381W2D9_9ZZZZ
MAQSTQGVGVKSGLSDQQKITDSKESLGLASKGKDQKPQGVGPGQSIGGGMKLDGKA